MADMMVCAPSMHEIAERIQSTRVNYAGEYDSVHDFVARDRIAARQRRAVSDDATIFRRFGAALLERNVTGASYDRRIEVFDRHLANPALLDAEQAENMLRESKYRFPPQGVSVLLALRELVMTADFSWLTYFSEAEEVWESGFEQDPMLTIKGVGYKTRDFALSEFSDYFCACDLHVRRLIARTGLLLRGYGDPDIATGSDDVDYRFLRRLIQKLAKETGFPDQPNGLSPAHIDGVLWYFGQGWCGAHPNCKECAANHVCLTGVNR